MVDVAMTGICPQAVELEVPRGAPRPARLARAQGTNASIQTSPSAEVLSELSQ
jgi:hypothetical protein